MELFKYWGWEDTWALGLFLAVVAFVALGIFAICQDHKPKFFFVTNSQNGFCVTGYQEWASNSTAFCSDDIHKSLDVMDRMNRSLKGAK